MERLTQRDEYGNADIIALSDMMPEIYAGLSFSETNALTDVLNRLAAYEDTGLTPTQIKYMLPKQSVKEAVERMKAEKERYDEWFAWKQAETEGRLVVLPCKVGDTLYEIDLPEYGVIVCKVMWMILKNDVSVQVEVTEGHGLGSGYCFELSDFGKTVFRTREEAEAKLKECGE